MPETARAEIEAVMRRAQDPVGDPQAVWDALLGLADRLDRLERRAPLRQAREPGSGADYGDGGVGEAWG